MKRVGQTLLVLAAVILILCAPQSARAQAVNAVTPGEFIIDHPTLINLGFEWMIQGDDNRNATVEVSYRKRGETQWKQGMPLFRLQGEEVYGGDRIDVKVPNMFAGSILDLTPDTEYECQFVMKDPDGVKGEATKTVTVKTRPEPKPYVGSHVYHVYPHNFQGTKMQPAFEGLLCAYMTVCSGTDWATSARPRVEPGDIIYVHGGLYKYDAKIYTNDLPTSTVTYDGTYYLTGKGTRDKPIAIIGYGDGEAIFDGNGVFNLFNLKTTDYHYFENLTIRNTDIAMWAGTQFQQGSTGLTVKWCKFDGVGMAIYTNWSGSQDYYISDNYVIGRLDPDHQIGWSGPFWAQFAGVESQRYPPHLDSYIGIKVYGPGHVIQYNYVTRFHDGIDTETYGNPDGSDAVKGPLYPPRAEWDKRTNSIDYLNNYMTNFHDNSFEVDGSMHNVRAMRNMMINSASQPMCNQPNIGGPTYWIRNVIYNTPNTAARLSGGAGSIFYNNTIFSEFTGGNTSNTHLRNNLILAENSFLGGPGPISPIPITVFGFTTFTNYTSSDYNAFYPNPGAPYNFQWNSPPKGVVADYNDRKHNAAIENRNFKTLEEYQKATDQDQHSILIDYNDFVKVTKLDGHDLKTVQKLYKAEDFDFGLKPTSKAVDAGVVISNVTDGFTGKAPDMGAYETGQPVPHYGPRPYPGRQP